MVVRRALAAASLLLVAGCSGTTAPGPAGSPSPSTATVAAPPQAVEHAVRTVRRYLRAWVTAGPSAAGRYLVPEQRARTDAGYPRLRSGEVVSVEVHSVPGPSEVVLIVSLDLDFADDPQGWSRGENTRFVTATRVDDRRYLLSFATGP